MVTDYLALQFLQSLGAQGVTAIFVDYLPEEYAGGYAPVTNRILLNPQILKTVYELVHVLQYQKGGGYTPEPIGFPFGQPSSQTKKFIRAHYPQNRWRIEYEAFALKAVWEVLPEEVEDWLRSQFST